jgi:hypothetical protein
MVKNRQLGRGYMVEYGAVDDSADRSVHDSTYFVADDVLEGAPTS